jgi:hypothetical protein
MYYVRTENGDYVEFFYQEDEGAYVNSETGQRITPAIMDILRAENKACDEMSLPDGSSVVDEEVPLPAVASYTESTTPRPTQSRSEAATPTPTVHSASKGETVTPTPEPTKYGTASEVTPTPTFLSGSRADTPTPTPLLDTIAVTPTPTYRKEVPNDTPTPSEVRIDVNYTATPSPVTPPTPEPTIPDVNVATPKPFEDDKEHNYYAPGHTSTEDMVKNYEGEHLKVFNGFKVGEGDSAFELPAGDYKIENVHYVDPNNHEKGIVMVVSDSNGNYFEIPNNVLTQYAADGTVAGHDDHGIMWSNSAIYREDEKVTPSTFNASINKDNTTPITYTTDTGEEKVALQPNTFRESVVQGDTEYGLRDASERQAGVGQKLQIGDQIVTAPYRKNEHVMINGKEYVVTEYLGVTDDGKGYTLTLTDPTDGSVIETSTTTMEAEKAKVIESAIKVGSDYGVDTAESARQHAYEVNGRRTSGANTFNVDDQQKGTIYSGYIGDAEGIKTISKEEYDAKVAEGEDVSGYTYKGRVPDKREVYIKYGEDGTYRVFDKNTGELIKDYEVSDLHIYELEAADGHGIQGSYTVDNGVTKEDLYKEYSNSTVSVNNKCYVISDLPEDHSKMVGNVIKVGGKTATIVSYDAATDTVKYKFDGSNELYDMKVGSQDTSEYQYYGKEYDSYDAFIEEKYEEYTKKNDGYRVTGYVTDPGNADLGRAAGTSQAIDRRDIYDDAMWSHNITQTGTLPGLDSGNVLKYQNKQEAINMLVNSQQWTRQDARQYVNDLESSGQIQFIDRSSKKTKYFVEPFTTYKDKIKGGEFVNKVTELKSSVQTLREQTNAILAQMDGWAGAASQSAMEAIRTIQGKLQVTMGNIEQALEPACYACEHLEEKLEELEKEDQVLEELLKDQEEKKNAYDAVYAEWNAMPDTISKTVADGKNDDGSTKYKTVNEHNDAKDAKKGEVDAAKTAYDEATEAVEQQQVKMDELEEEILEMIELIEDLQTVIKQFSSYVSPSGSNYHKISSADNIVKYYNDILYDFENFERLPAITNLSDYQVGDIVLFDDGYGYLYKVVEVFDGDGKSTGYVKIQRCDEHGNIIPGSKVLTIWDQREITPVERKLWSPPDPVPTPEPAPEPTPTKTSGGGNPTPTQTKKPGPDPTPKPTTTPAPNPTTSTPAPTVTSTPAPTVTTTPSPTVTPVPPTPPPLPPTYPPVPTPPPAPVPPTAPPRPLPPTAAPEYIPEAPATGIGAALGNTTTGGVVKENNADSLGALAGILAGAAGVGLTAMAKDKDEDEKKEKEEGKDEEKDDNLVNPYNRPEISDLEKNQ